MQSLVREIMHMMMDAWKIKRREIAYRKIRKMQRII